MTSFRALFATLSAGLLLFLLAACATSPQDKPGANAPRPDELARLAQLEKRGDYAAAAVLAGQLAQRAKPPQQYDLRLRGADNLIKARRISEAVAILDNLELSRLDEGQSLLRRLLRAEVALGSGRAAQALELLGKTPPGGPSALQQRFFKDRAEALRVTGNLLESAKALSELDLLLEDSPDRAANQQQLLRTLTTMTDTSLQLLRPQPPGILGGWMDLARIVKAASGKQLDTQLGKWREEYPSHPALPEVLHPGRVQQSESGPAPARIKASTQIAVLLPDSGRFVEAGNAIRDGLLAAAYAQPAEQRAQLRFYDASEPSRIESLVQKAADEGAIAVIGPLQKEAVQKLVRAASLPIPVLALNRLPATADANPPAKLYQFALDPDDEARQAADRAWADGSTSALTLTPEGAWGERLLQSFRGRWETLGGRLVGQQTYKSEQTDSSAPIGRLLAGAAPLPGPVALFLVVPTPAKALELWPQLQAQWGANLAVYATSHVYSGQFHPEQDQPLVGLTFADIPWLVQPNDQGPLSRAQLPATLGSRQGLMLRLFAMGIDSYQLVSRLDQLQTDPTATLAGATGELSLGPGHQIQRRLAWARLGIRGPEPLGSSPSVTLSPGQGQGQPGGSDRAQAQ
jgi:outer membrane PBP1 activator LpoA protein